MVNWDEMSEAQRVSFPVAGQEYPGGGYIPGPGQSIFVRPLQPKQSGDIDDQIIDPKTLQVVAHVRWNADGSMSYRD